MPDFINVHVRTSEGSERSPPAIQKSTVSYGHRGRGNGVVGHESPLPVTLTRKQKLSRIGRSGGKEKSFSQTLEIFNEF